MEKAASTASPEWKTHYQTIDRLLTDLVGAPTAAEAGRSWHERQCRSADGRGADGEICLDFRTHLTAFSAAMGNVAPAAERRRAGLGAGGICTSPGDAAARDRTSATAPPARRRRQCGARVGGRRRAAGSQVLGMIEGVLKANAPQTGGTVSIERSTLEQMKMQLEQIRASVKKQ